METDLDRLHAAMNAAPENDAARLAFYDRLADAELFLLLAEEPLGDTIEPALVDLEEGRAALAFDTEARLAAFAEGPAPYAALPGRVVARLLSAEGLGLGLNLAVAPSATLLPAGALGWLAGMLGQAPAEAAARPVAYGPPAGVPQALLAALDAKLARLAGLAARAHLVAVTWEGGGQGHLLVVEDALPGAEAALAKAVSEALVFSGIEAGALDVTFLASGDAALGDIARQALSFDLPAPAVETAQVLSPAAPGTDPSRPPRLR
jgi:hypothetical protein